MSACLFARVRVVAIIVAPTNFAIWNAAIPTLLDAAVTMTKSPVLSLACSMRAPHAVTYCIQDAAATSNEMFSGCLIRLGAEHDFRTIEADTLHLDLHFVGSRWGDIQVFNFQNTWIAVAMESNDTCHGFLL